MTINPISNPAVLDELPVGTEIRDADGDAGFKDPCGGWLVIGYAWALDSDWFSFPVEVVDPTPATAELVADLTGPVTMPAIKAEVRGIVADIRSGARAGALPEVLRRLEGLLAPAGRP
ncbi:MULTISPECIES: hypothetical protein [Streptomyces]|uniref:hypothetical protein n=1 Tax=Streptomyces TaxID=1883 RepID=UPI00226D66C0|nr:MULTISPECIES: hypothetical protein [unclassified Streptomyces]MCY0921696.1 hypothetical protein [Streptomyces sp. H27-G5]MCY0944029.1 hypothetical protein [Streptomyces sp. H34-AA3]MCY0956252.1 hypothetical protein [Streptomyces sp. H27-H5]MCZ4082271.1 hypothetical protein [Streptomyces sp. H34-S5]